MTDLIFVFDKLFLIIVFIFFKGAIRGYVPDRRHIATISIPEQQPTVAYTKDLSLQIDFLPGEDEVKLQEGKIIEIFIIN